MPWYNSKRATTVIDDGDGFQACVYHQTKVVRWSPDTVILNSGGHLSVTTKRRMNEVSYHYHLGFLVTQKAGDWFVNYRGKVLPFSDGMVLS